MKIELEYFASLRDERGLSRETVETEAKTADDLYRSLAQKHGLSLTPDELKVAINDEFSDWSQTLQPGDTVVFVPPVAGG